MAKPSSTFTWATDANFSTGPRSGQPTTVTPLAGELAQGFIPGSSFPSEWANYVLEIAGEWTVWANTYAAGLELNNTFVGSNTFGGTTAVAVMTASGLATFNGQVTTNSILNANGVAYFNDTVDLFADVTVDGAAVLTADGVTNLNAEVVLGASAYIDSPMSTSSNSRVEGPWKISHSTNPYTYNSGVCGTTRYSVNPSLAIGAGITSTVHSIAIDANSIFHITVSISTFTNGATAPESSIFYLSGGAGAASITLDQTTIANHSIGVIFNHHVSTSGLNIILQVENGSGVSQTTRNLITYDIHVSDDTQ